MRHLKIALRIFISLGMSAFFVWLSLRKADLRAVLAAMGAADPRRITLYVGLLLVIHVLRTLRWGILLEPLGRVSLKRLNSASAVGWMLLMVLPLRLGECARPLLIARPPPGGGATLSRSGAMASIVVERIVDGIAIGILGIVSLRFVDASGRYLDFARRASWLVAAGFFVLCLALVLAVLFRDRAVAIVRSALLRVSPRIAARASRMLESFIGAVHVGSGLSLLWFFVLTFAYWFVTAWGLGIVAVAFGFDRLTPLMLAVILTIQVVGVMVPAGPGMIGTMQFFTQAGLSLFAADAFSARGAAYANTVWLLQFCEQVGLGVLFLLAGHVSLKGLFGPRALDEDAAAASP
jgi:uncharacterized protein (TIRG00374 family)